MLALYFISSIYGNNPDFKHPTRQRIFYQKHPVFAGFPLSAFPRHYSLVPILPMAQNLSRCNVTESVEDPASRCFTWGETGRNRINKKYVSPLISLGQTHFCGWWR